MNSLCATTTSCSAGAWEDFRESIKNILSWKGPSLMSRNSSWHFQVLLLLKSNWKTLFLLDFLCGFYLSWIAAGEVQYQSPEIMCGAEEIYD